MPRRTLAEAERLLAGRSVDPRTRSFLRQARGIALRELGDIGPAIRQLQAAVRDAAQVDDDRLSDVESSLAGTLAIAGRHDDAVRVMESASARVSGVAAARIGVRLGSLLGLAGRPDDAARELRAATRVLRRAGDTVWESRAVSNLGMALIELGDTARAEVAMARSEELITGTGQLLEAAAVRHQRGLIAVLEGRLPDALTHYELARQRYVAAGASSPYLYDARAAALLAVGLLNDAMTDAERAVADSQAPGASSTYRAHALVRAAQVALALGRLDDAASYAREASRRFGRQQNQRGRAAAELVAVQARYAGGERSRRLLRTAGDLALDLRRQRSSAALDADLLAGELALALRDPVVAKSHLGRVAQARRRGTEPMKVLGWRAVAAQAQAAGRRPRVFAACEQGLQALARHQLTLGSTEARAAVTVHGLPLAQLALRAAVSTQDPALVLAWVERWRATTVALASLPADADADADGQLNAALARLRLARLRLTDPAHTAARPAEQARAVAVLEDDVRRLTLQLAGADDDVGPASASRAVDDVVSELVGTQLLELFVLDGMVHALAVRRGVVTHHVCGSYRDVLKLARYCQFLLRRVADRTRPTAVADLCRVGSLLERAMLGDAAALLDDGPTVVVPPAALSFAPWGLLPTLGARCTSVTPSAASWVRARRGVPVSDGVVLVAGPGLRHADAEVAELTRRHAGATVLAGADASSDRVLAAFEGAALAHVAAHGVFRDDNPMFSALTLTDGPLTIFDLQRLTHAPHRIVLSCCDTGAIATTGADEMLGLLTALLPRGTAGLLAATVPVADDSALQFSASVHDSLLAGTTMAQALLTERGVAGDEPERFAVAHAFVAYGAA